MTNKNPKLLIEFFSKKYYGAYVQMMIDLRPMLTHLDQDIWQVERLEFRPDLPRGCRKEIFLSIACLLRHGKCVFDNHYCKNDLLRWLTDPRNSNLGIKFQTLQDAVNKQIKCCNSQ